MHLIHSVLILIENSLKFVPNDPINNKPALFQRMDPWAPSQYKDVVLPE